MTSRDGEEGLHWLASRCQVPKRDGMARACHGAGHRMTGTTFARCIQVSMASRKVIPRWYPLDHPAGRGYLVPMVCFVHFPGVVSLAMRVVFAMPLGSRYPRYGRLFTHVPR